MTLHLISADSQRIPHVAMSAAAARVTGLILRLAAWLGGGEPPRTGCGRKPDLNLPFFVEVCHLESISGSTRI